MERKTPAEAEFSFVASGPTRVLAVDDDPILREFAIVYLSTPMTKIETAESAEAALAMMEGARYDILLVDIDMPGMDGIEMVRAIRSSSRISDIPVVMVTGCDDVVSIDRAYAAGANSFVTKPVNWRLLSYHLRFVLRACRLPTSGAAAIPLPPPANRFALAANDG